MEKKQAVESKMVFGYVAGSGRKHGKVRGHIAIDVSLKGVSVRDAAFAWAAVQPGDEQAGGAVVPDLWNDVG